MFSSVYVGPFALLVLILDIWALVNIFGAPHVSTGGKLLWLLLIIFMPLVGFLVWLVAGPRNRGGAGDLTTDGTFRPGGR